MRAALVAGLRLDSGGDVARPGPGTGAAVAGEQLHDRRADRAVGRDDHAERRLRHRLGQLQPGRSRPRHFRSALRPPRKPCRKRLPGEYLHLRRPVQHAGRRRWRGELRGGLGRLHGQQFDAERPRRCRRPGLRFRRGTDLAAFTVNDPTADPEQRPAVAMSEVGFVVAFHRTVPLVTSTDVFAQRYEPDGDRIRATSRSTPTTPRSRRTPKSRSIGREVLHHVGRRERAREPTPTSGGAPTTPPGTPSPAISSSTRTRPDSSTTIRSRPTETEASSSSGTTTSSGIPCARRGTTARETPRDPRR